MAAGKELDVTSVTGDSSSDKGQIALADAAFEAVTDLYLELETAIKDSSKRTGFQQPWNTC